MTAALKDLVGALPLLSNDQLQEIRDRASALLAIGPASEPAGRAGRADPADEFVRDLYGALAEELERRTRVKSAPFHAFASTTAFRDRFRPAARQAFVANSSWFPGQSKAERLSMTRLYARLCLDYLAGQSRPAVWHNISAAVNVLPQVVDGAFPGYAAAGLLGKVQSLRTRSARTPV